MSRPGGKAGFLANQKVQRRSRGGGRGHEHWQAPRFDGQRGAWLLAPLRWLFAGLVFLLGGVVMGVRGLLEWGALHQDEPPADPAETTDMGWDGRLEPSLRSHGQADEPIEALPADLELPDPWQGGEELEGSDTFERAAIARLEREEAGLPQEELVDQAAALRAAAPEREPPASFFPFRGGRSR